MTLIAKQAAITRFAAIAALILCCIPLLNIFSFSPSLFEGLEDPRTFSYILLSAIAIASILIYTALAPKHVTSNINLVDILYFCYASFIVSRYYFQNSFQNDLLFSFICSFILYILLKETISKARQKEFDPLVIAISFFLAVSNIESIYAVLQIFKILPSLNSFYQVTGTFQNPGALGIFLSISFCCALTVAFFYTVEGPKGKFLKLLSWLSIFQTVLILPSTHSRSAWLSSISVSIWLILIRWKKLNQWMTKRKILGTIILLALLTAGLFLMFFYKPNSASGRLLIWKTIVPMAEKNPLSGVGFNQFKNKHLLYQQQYFQSSDRPQSEIMIADKDDYVFNDYLQILVENGVVGFLLFFGVVFSTVPFYRQATPKQDSLSWAAGMGFTSLLISSFFSYPLQLSSFLNIFSFLLAILSSQQKYFWNKSFRISNFITLPIAGLAIYLLFYVEKIEWAELNVEKTLTVANRFMQDELYDDALSIYQNGYRKIPHEKNILLSYGKCLYLKGAYQNSIDTLHLAEQFITDPFLSITMGDDYTALKQYNDAEKAYNDAIWMIPNRFYPRYQLVNMYLSAGDSVSARLHAAEILNLRIKISSPAVLQIRSEMNKLVSFKP